MPILGISCTTLTFVPIQQIEIQSVSNSRYWCLKVRYLPTYILCLLRFHVQITRVSTMYLSYFI